jgi:hypothetical protein
MLLAEGVFTAAGGPDGGPNELNMFEGGDATAAGALV